MIFTAAKSPVFNRGSAPQSFLEEMVAWAKKAPDDIFALNNKRDIYNKVRDELGPWIDFQHRKAVMLEVMRVLAGFESSWDWKEGVDTSRLGDDTPENSEAGAWQVSYDARFLAPELGEFLVRNGIHSGKDFQQETKFNHGFAMGFVSRLLRHNTKHNGPLYKGDERNAIRSSLRGPEHSIYPWLSRDSMREFYDALSES